MMNRRLAFLGLLILGLSGLGAQNLPQAPSFLGKPFGAVLEAKGSPQGLGREPGFLDTQAVSRFFASCFDYYLSCDDRYLFNSGILLDLASKLSSQPLRDGFSILAYPGESFWVDGEGRVAAVQYSLPAQPLPPAFGSMASMDETVARLGPSLGRVEDYRRFAPPPGLPGSGDILVLFEGGKATRVVLLSPSFPIPESWDWGQYPPSAPEGRP